MYGISSNKKTVQIAMLVGLAQMEHLAEFRTPVAKKLPPVEPARQLPNPKLFPPSLEAEMEHD